MAQQSPRNHARAALLDRLIDHDPTSHVEARPLRTMNPSELYESVARELSRLLNTRCPLTIDALQDRERSVIDYGVPDFASYSPQSIDDQERLAYNIKETIRIYETRLQDVRVQIEEHEKRPKALLIKINAMLVMESIREPVSFPIIMEDKGEKISFNAI